MSYVDAVLFDLDDTLFDHRATSRAALAALQAGEPALQRLDLDTLERRHVALLEELHEAGVMQGVVPVDEARVERFRRLLEEAGEPPARARALALDVAPRYRAAYAAARRAVPGARALLEIVRARVRVGVVSNNILTEQEAKLAQLGMRRLVDVLVVSAEEGVSKPDPAIFLATLERLGARAERAVMVGDSWATDVAGAHRAGIRAVWFNRHGEPSPDPSMAIEITALEPAETIASTILDRARR